MTKPKGIHANFAVDCSKCGSEFTVTNARHDPHDCEPPALAAIRAALETKGAR